MAKNEAKIRFTAETGEFNDQIKKSNDEMGKLRAEMKLNEEQMKSTGTTVEGLQNSQKILGEQLDASRKKTEALSQKVEKAKEIYGENSTEVQKLQTQLLNAQTAEVKIERALASCNDELKRQKDATKQVETATDKLTDTINDQRNDLDRLKKEYVEAVLKYGETSDEARKLAGQIDKLSSELKSNKKAMADAEEAADKLENSLDDVEESADKAGVSLKDIGGKVVGGVVAGFTALATAAAASVTAFLGTAEATREYREDMNKLQTAFKSAGYTAKEATDTYKSFFSILGEEDRSVEAVSHLAKMSLSQQELSKWTDICAGVWGTFGDSLPIEGLTEASNETAKVGQLTGVLADALNWAGVSEEEFQAKLDGLNTEEERAALITDTLNKLYSEASANYKELNKDVIEAQRAQSELTDATAGIGAAAEPVMTSIKFMGAAFLTSLTPAVELIGEGLTGALNGTEGASAKLAEGLGGVLTSVVTGLGNILPTVVTVINELFPALVNMLNSNAPMLLSSLVGLVLGLVTSLAQQLPTIAKTVVSLIGELFRSVGSALPTLVPVLVTGILDAVLAIFENADQLINGAIALIDGLARGIILALPILIAKLPIIIQSILDALLNGDASIIQMIMTLLPYIVVEIVKMIPSIIGAIGQILASVATFLWDRIMLTFNTLKPIMEQAGQWLYDNLIVPVKAFFADLWQWVVDLFTPAAQWVYDKIIAPVAQFFTDLWNGIVNAYHTVIDPWIEIFKKLATIVYDSVISPVLQYFKNLWADIKNVFVSAWTWFDSTVVQPVANVFNNMWQGLKNGAKNAWEGVKSVFSKVASFFGDIFRSAWEKVKAVFSTGGKIFTGIKDGIISAFKKVVNVIIGGLNKVIPIPFNGLNKVLNRISSISILDIKPFSWLTWRAPVPQIPLLAEGGILTRPTLNIAGEAGPEAIIPLDKLQNYISGAVERTMQNDNLYALAQAVADLANRPIDLNINGQKFATATASDTDFVNGGRMALSKRGLAL